MALVGIGVIARMLERDPKAIRNAVRSGRITQRPDGLFDTDVVMAEWEANTNHELGRKGRPNKNVVQMASPLDPVTNVLASAPVDPLPRDEELAEKNTKATDFAKARAASQIYDARLKKLRYEEKAGNLVPARDVEDAAHKALRCIRDACLSIPSRVSNQIASETNAERIYQLLEKEISAVFEDFAEGKIA